jgi:hypothetical protein
MTLFQFINFPLLHNQDDTFSFHNFLNTELFAASFPYPISSSLLLLLIDFLVVQTDDLFFLPQLMDLFRSDAP